MRRVAHHIATYSLSYYEVFPVILRDVARHITRCCSSYCDILLVILRRIAYHITRYCPSYYEILPVILRDIAHHITRYCSSYYEILLIILRSIARRIATYFFPLLFQRMRSKVSLACGLFAMSASKSVLFVFKSSRREVQLSPGRPVCDLLSDELKKAGHEATVCVSEAPGNAKPPVYILQRWSEKWQAFIDVSNESEIVDGDKLTVIPKPGLSPVGKHASI